MSTTSTGSPLSSNNNLCVDCGPGGLYADSCTNLHVYYVGGALCTIIGSLFVILSYCLDNNLRQHPSVLIFMRCIFDLLFGILFFIIYLTPIKTLTCNDSSCERLGPIMLFVFLCSNGYFAASIADLYLSLKNPFSSPHKLTNKIHAIVVIICLSITLIIRFAFNADNDEKAFSYRPDIQFCFISPVSLQGINPLNLIFVYIPIISIVLIGFFVNISAFYRLRKGLPDTFAIRMRSVQDAFAYSVGFTLYFIPLGIMYFSIWYQDSSAINLEEEFYSNNSVHIAFAVLLGCLGINDFVLWFCRKFRKKQTKQLKEDKCIMMAQLKIDDIIDEQSEIDIRYKQKRNKIMSRTDLKQMLVPQRPDNLYRANSDKTAKQNKNKSQSKLFSLLKQISIKPNTKGITINKALRREVLAYTTDGIAQSIQRAKKLSEKTGFNTIMDNFEPRPKDYPSNMNDEHGATIQRFGIYIKHNCSLLYRSNNRNIVSDSQYFSFCDAFGSKSKQEMLIQANPPTVHQINRVATNLVIKNDDDDDDYNIDDDYDRYHHVALQKMGKERQFVDYAPLIFRYIRVKLLSMHDKEYLSSIIPATEKQQKKVLDAKFGDGKSGAFFYFTHDSRFIVKTIKKHELELLLEILPDYIRHLKNNPNTILSRCVGLHSIKIYGLYMYFLVMENVFLAKLKPHETYDLKGSWVGRGINERYDHLSGKVMKDNDLKRFIILNKKNRKQIIQQINRDTKFLSAHQIMDYSLLLGIYHMKICQSDKASSTMKKASCITSDDETDDDSKYDDNYYDYQNNESHNTYAGGVQAQVIEGPGIYYMGIIDALQKYNFRKRMETLFRTYIQRKDGDGISCVDPEKYRKRFINYMKNIIINDNDYFQELDIKHNTLEKQTMYAYPPKGDIQENMAILRKQKMSRGVSLFDDDDLKEKALLPSAITLDHLDAIDKIHSNQDSELIALEMNTIEKVDDVDYAGAMLLNANINIANSKLKK